MSDEKFIPTATQFARARSASVGVPCPHFPPVEGYYRNTVTGTRERGLQAFSAMNSRECLTLKAETMEGEKVLQKTQEENDHLKMVNAEFESTIG